MPKDDWNKANLRAKYGPVAEKHHRSPSGKPARSKRQKRRGRAVRRCHSLPKTGAWNKNSVLWFGKHKGKALRDVPEHYLTWLADQPAHSSWRINDLSNYLREYFRSRAVPEVQSTT